MNTFTHEVSFASKDFNPKTDKVETTNKKRIFTFKELDEYDQDQQQLHWKINFVFEAAIGENDEKLGTGKKKIQIESDAAHELVVKFVNNCLVTDGDKQKELNKKELLMNSKALFKLGTWLIYEKFLPFFLIFRSE